MCCVMPPASPSATFVSRMASSRVVLPWSTCPMTVTTGARTIRSSGFALLRLDDDHLLLERAHLHVRAERPGDGRRRFGIERRVDGHHHAPFDQLLEHVLGLDFQALGQVLDGHALGQRDGPRNRRRRRRRGRSLGPRAPVLGAPPARPVMRPRRRRTVADCRPGRQRARRRRGAPAGTAAAAVHPVAAERPAWPRRPAEWAVRRVPWVPAPSAQDAASAASVLDSAAAAAEAPRARSDAAPVPSGGAAARPKGGRPAGTVGTSRETDGEAAPGWGATGVLSAAGGGAFTSTGATASAATRAMSCCNGSPSAWTLGCSTVTSVDAPSSMCGDSASAATRGGFSASARGGSILAAGASSTWTLGCSTLAGAAACSGGAAACSGGAAAGGSAGAAGGSAGAAGGSVGAAGGSAGAAACSAVTAAGGAASTRGVCFAARSACGVSTSVSEAVTAAGGSSTRMRGRLEPGAAARPSTRSRGADGNGRGTARGGA